MHELTFLTEASFSISCLALVTRLDRDLSSTLSAMLSREVGDHLLVFRLAGALTTFLGALCSGCHCGTGRGGGRGRATLRFLSIITKVGEGKGMIGRPLSRLSWTNVLVVGVVGGEGCDCGSSSGVGQRDDRGRKEVVKKGRDWGSWVWGSGVRARSLPDCISRENEERRNFGRKRGETAGDPVSNTPRLRLRRLFDLIEAGMMASVASSTEETDEDRSLCLRKLPSLSPQESAGVVGTDKFCKLILGTLWWVFGRGRLPYWVSLLNLTRERVGVEVGV